MVYDIGIGLWKLQLTSHNTYMWTYCCEWSETKVVLWKSPQTVNRERKEKSEK